MKRDIHNSYKVAIGGVVSALCLVLMFLTGVMPLLSMAIPIYAGALMIVVAKEVSASWAFAAYCAVSLLSLFLTPDKDASSLFIIFFGYYPILLPKLNSLSLRPIRIIIKLAIFNIAMIVWYKLTVLVTGMYDFFSEFSFLGEYAVAGVMIFINLVFLLYDYTIKMIDNCYTYWFRPKYLGKQKPKLPQVKNTRTSSKT